MSVCCVPPFVLFLGLGGSSLLRLIQLRCLAVVRVLPFVATWFAVRPPVLVGWGYLRPMRLVAGSVLGGYRSTVFSTRRSYERLLFRI